MRKIALLLLAVGTVGLGSGCVIALGNKGSLTARGGARQAVALDGNIYIVDTRNGRVSKIDPEVVRQAPPSTQEEISQTEISVVED
jgi:hypothetical protein